MIPVTVYSGRKVALFGLGGSGTATALALRAGGAVVEAFDDNPAKLPEAERLGITIRDLKQADWSGYAALILSPGVPFTHPEPHWSVTLARVAQVEVIGDIELFCRQRAREAPSCAFVAVTGTNGKSTTTALTAHILAGAGFDVQTGGNIGKPVLSLAPLTPSRVYVIECSTFQIDLAPSLEASVGVLLNLSPDHLDRHGGMEHYAALKERLIQAAGFAVIGDDDEFSRAVAERRKGPFVRIAAAHAPQGGGVYADGSRVLEQRGDGAPERVADLAGIASLRGAHNAQNACAAVATARHYGVAPKVIDAALKTFPGLAHRMEQVGVLGSTIFINDSKATNADSTEKALLSFSNIYWILGGKPKAGGITSLAPLFPKVVKAYLIGQATDEFAATLDGHAVYEKCGTLENALDAAMRDATLEPGRENVVLLSPACASYDQFPNFEVRGDRFRELVRQITGAA
ncbi:MAG: UDP-N-acetylmuramoyl-L-alanine--D-glutamate ligase [Methylobacteriaceae bacterium]|jgi:UDP-N-acetylmuramoylalanine--D-glutamate ligase|nr:UDP-N-acetylmuramoyl-L-alanine--D-glutamate ligase [Methylobacteriaceae bacterium]